MIQAADLLLVTTATVEPLRRLNKIGKPSVTCFGGCYTNIQPALVRSSHSAGVSVLCETPQSNANTRNNGIVTVEVASRRLIDCLR